MAYNCVIKLSVEMFNGSERDFAKTMLILKNIEHNLKIGHN